MTRRYFWLAVQMRWTAWAQLRPSTRTEDEGAHAGEDALETVYRILAEVEARMAIIECGCEAISSCSGRARERTDEDADDGKVALEELAEDGGEDAVEGFVA
jgi:hypothetical protein